jgi:hypothetical protein
VGQAAPVDVLTVALGQANKKHQNENEAGLKKQKKRS